MMARLFTAVLVVLAAAAARAEGFRFALYGDSCGNPAVHARIAAAIAARKPAFVVHTGDFVPQGDKGAGWCEHFLDPAAPLLAACRLFACDGDNDRGAFATFCKQFGLPPDRPWRSWTHGDAAFFALSARAPFGADAPQVRWLAEALAASRARWKIVVTHYPLYSCGRHGGQDGLRRSIIATLFRHGVDLVLSGHDHCYERTHAIGPEPGAALVQIVSGGGGQTLGVQTPQAWTARAARRHHFCVFDVQPERITFTAISDAGEELDRFVFAQRAGRRDFGRFLRAEDVELLCYIRRFERLRFGFEPGRQQSRRLGFTVKNAHARELRGELAWQVANPRWRVEPMRQAIVVPPGGEARVSFEAAWSPGPPGAKATPLPLPRAVLISGGLRATAPGFYLHEAAPRKRR